MVQAASSAEGTVPAIYKKSVLLIQDGERLLTQYTVIPSYNMGKSVYIQKKIQLEGVSKMAFKHPVDVEIPVKLLLRLSTNIYILFQ